MSVASPVSATEVTNDAEVGSPLRAKRWRRVLTVGLLIFAIFFASPNSDGGDGYLVVPTAYSMVHDHDLDLREFSDADWYKDHYAVSELNGRTVNYFPWLTSVFAVPAVIAADVLHAAGLAGDQGEAIRAGAISTTSRLTASAVAALAALALALMAERLLKMAESAHRAGDSAVAAWLRSDGERTFEIFALVMAMGTSLWSTASRSMWQHGPSMLIGALGVLGLLRLIDGQPGETPSANPFREHCLAAATGAALAFSYWIRPTNFVLTLVGLGVLWFCRRRSLIVVTAAMGAAHLGMLGFNFLFLGTTIPPYFKASRFEFHDQYLQAVGGNLISPARGLLLFSPFLMGAALLVLPSRWRLLNRNNRIYVAASLTGAAAYLAVVSGFAEKWWAGISYGPRFMSESVILLGPLALVGIFGPRTVRAGSEPRLAFRLIAVIAITFSFVAHGSGAMLTGVMCWGDRGRANYPSRVWDWSDSQILEGPDLLMNGGISAAMNRDCPRT